MEADSRRRGQPLFALVAILALWCAARVALWESPFALPVGTAPLLASGAAASDVFEARAQNGRPADRAIQPAAIAPPGWFATTPIGSYGSAEMLPLTAPGRMAVRNEAMDVMASHQLMYLAAFRRIPVQGDLAQLLGRATDVAPTIPTLPTPHVRPDRWSLDAWAFIRGGSGGVSSGPLPAAYGASQAGGVLRYQFDPGDARRSSAYLRLTGAPVRGGEAEAALGLSARPIPALPIAALAEVRARRVGGRTEYRPAILAATEIAPVDLPRGARAEIYAQGGYVGGTFATPFADGQLRVTGPVAEFDLGEVRIGAGSWGGAQRGAARLDIGPTAALELRVGEAPARLSVDYRVRVAGDAEPGSGMAVTLSTGF